jgi:hypothetical protein
MSFAVVLEGMALVAYVIVLSGGKRLRESGWKILSLLIILSAIVQAASMSIVVGSGFPDCAYDLMGGGVLMVQAYLFDNEDRFFVGWRLDESWIYCTVSWCVSLFCAGALVFAAHTLPSEGGYELIPDHS